MFKSATKAPAEESALPITAPLPSGERPPETLADIERISDLYGYIEVAEGSGLVAGGEGAYCYFGESRLAHLAGTELAVWADDILAHVQKTVDPDAEDFHLIHNGRAYRGLLDRSPLGTHVALRVPAAEAPRLQDLVLDTPAIRTLLEAEWLNDGGLVVVCGLTGSGKTTLAGGTVRTRLELYAGRCVSVEDIPEVRLEGVWGGGSCRQLIANHEHPVPFRRGFTGAVRRAYRSLPAARPAILFVGEVRDAETAVEVVKAAANGMLVITTLHSGDPVGAVIRLMSLAMQVMGEDNAALNIAHALRMVVHHHLLHVPGGEGWGKRKFLGSCLVSDSHTSAVGNIIKSGKLTQLTAELAFQSTHFAKAKYQQPPASQLLETLCRANK